ncbi:DnaJ-like protein [Streptomyces sp. 846.5]|nr:DnaJ domain-containing protein [Streptomyces sp. 846.5]TDT93298.1 DnaJ-like protein [Streptomyces sp. 846.5]
MGGRVVARNVREKPRASERLWCEMCSHSWTRPVQGGKRPRYCSDACKQRAYRQRVKAERETEREAAEREAQWQREYAQRERLRQERAERERSRAGGSWSSTGFGGSSGRSGSGSSSSAGSGRASALTIAEATRIIFDLAGLVLDAGSTTIKKAYRIAARRHHPDMGGDTEKFQLLEAAAAVLKLADLL